MIEFIKKNYSKLGMVLALTMLVINYYQQRELSKLRAEQKIEVVVGGDIQKANLIDSLHDELFISKVQNARYELSLEHLYEVNPTAGKEFTNFMEHETE
jgi:hypothetical protein